MRSERIGASFLEDKNKQDFFGIFEKAVKTAEAYQMDIKAKTGREAIVNISQVQDYYYTEVYVRFLQATLSSLASRFSDVFQRAAKLSHVIPCFLRKSYGKHNIIPY